VTSWGVASAGIGEEQNSRSALSECPPDLDLIAPYSALGALRLAARRPG